ncbi:hypothetical protein DFP86_11713 [Paludibacterium purpuratum]|uniref:Uncharacterized protein n=1 Tax=Paludibacterium purpuratum TaxID=1144873 RepID=A0A4R7AYY2_9NEIS|nr:hypothetical protein DFP86_11713 [Paludibacterium purpuratum]
MFHHAKGIAMRTFSCHFLAIPLLAGLSLPASADQPGAAPPATECSLKWLQELSTAARVALTNNNSDAAATLIRAATLCKANKRAQLSSN